MSNSGAPSRTIPFDPRQPPLELSSLQGRSVLITGGAAGIGFACATIVAQAGTQVTIADLHEATGRAAAQQLTYEGYKTQFVQCDVTSYAAQVDMFRQAISFGSGKIDIVIPCAGVMSDKNLFDTIPTGVPDVDSPPPPEPPYKGCEVNLQAVYNTCYLALHYFRIPREAAPDYRPSIILMSSLAGYVGFPSSSTYSASKFGVRGLFYGIRDRASREKPAVRVNLVAPWYIDTAMTRDEHFVGSEAALSLSVIGFAPMERVTDAVLRFATNENLLGRAAGIFPLAKEDLGDDLEGAFAGIVVQKHMGEARARVGKHLKDMAARRNELAQKNDATAAAQGGEAR